MTHRGPFQPLTFYDSVILWQHVAQGQGAQASLGRLDAATQPILARARCLWERLSGFLLLQQQWKTYRSSPRRSPVSRPCSTERPTWWKRFIKTLWFVPLKWGEGDSLRQHTWSPF